MQSCSAKKIKRTCDESDGLCEWYDGTNSCSLNTARVADQLIDLCRDGVDALDPNVLAAIVADLRRVGALTADDENIIASKPGQVCRLLTRAIVAYQFLRQFGRSEDEIRTRIAEAQRSWAHRYLPNVFGFHVKDVDEYLSDVDHMFLELSRQSDRPDRGQQTQRAINLLRNPPASSRKLWTWVLGGTVLLSLVALTKWLADQQQTVPPLQSSPPPDMDMKVRDSQRIENSQPPSPPLEPDPQPVLSGPMAIGLAAVGLTAIWSTIGRIPNLDKRVGAIAQVFGHLIDTCFNGEQNTSAKTLNELETKLNAAREEKKKLESQLKKAVQNVKDTESRLSEKIRQIEGSERTALAQKARLEEEKGKLQDRIDKVSSELEDWKRSFAQLRNSFEIKTKKVAELETVQEQNELFGDLLSDDVVELLRQEERAASDIEDLKKEIANGDLAIKRKQLLSLRDLNDDEFESQFAPVNTAYHQLFRDLRDKEAELALIKKQISVLRSLRQTKKRTDPNERRIERTLSRELPNIEELETKIEESSQLLSELSQEMHSKRVEMETFLRQWESKKEEINELKRTKEGRERALELLTQKAETASSLLLLSEPTRLLMNQLIERFNRRFPKKPKDLLEVTDTLPEAFSRLRWIHKHATEECPQT